MNLTNSVTEVRSSHCILKMKFSMPSPPNYMKGKDRLEYMEERAWVSNDFIDYAAREGKYADKATPTDAQFAIIPDKGNYLDYVSRRGTFADKGNKGQGEVGTGVWGKNGVLEGAELERMKKLFQKTESNIWHGIISPTKELGDKVLDTKAKAMEFTKACFTRFISSTHLKYDNIEWYCGWHDDSASGIKHIQFAFCEKEPHLSSKGTKAFTQKGCIRKTALADALINFEEYFSGHRNDVHIARDSLMERFKKLSPQEVKKDLAKDLLDLAKVLPKVNGRAGYRHKEFEPFRKQIDIIAERMLKELPELNQSYIDIMSKVAEREQRFNETAKQFQQMQPTDKVSELRQDIRERLGNSIISFARRVDYNERLQDYNSLRLQNLSLMALTQKEKQLRQKQKNQRRQDTKRFRRLFNTFYSSVASKDYLSEYYMDLERLKGGWNNRNNENDENTGE